MVGEHIFEPVRLQLRWHKHRKFGLYGSINGDRAISTPATSMDQHGGKGLVGDLLWT